MRLKPSSHASALASERSRARTHTIIKRGIHWRSRPKEAAPINISGASAPALPPKSHSKRPSKLLRWLICYEAHPSKSARDDKLGDLKIQE
jgi:hypothetical protein